MTHPEGIKDLQAREPIGAAISIGKKGPRGFPIDKTNFYIVAARAADDVRAPLPQFAFFNEADDSLRKVLRGNILHRTQAQAFEHRLTMQSFPKGYQAPRSHPNMRPVCEGDGVHAVRWMQGVGDKEFTNIRCPHQLCEFRQSDPPMCKPFMRLLFRLRWTKPELPTPLVKLTSRSWETTANFLGLFSMLNTAARELGIESPTLYGFPFTMTLIERTKAAKRARYPVVTVTPDQDPIDFFLVQKERLAQIQGPRPLALPEVQEPSEVYEDLKSVEVGE